RLRDFLVGERRPHRLDARDTEASRQPNFRADPISAPSPPIPLPGRPRGPTLTGSPDRWAARGPRPAAVPERGHRERTVRTPRGRRALARRRPRPPLAAARRRGLDTGAPRRPPPGAAPRDAAGRGGLRRRPPAATAPPRGVPAPPRRGRTHRLRRGLPGGRLGLRRPAGPADRAGREPRHARAPAAPAAAQALRQRPAGAPRSEE